MFPFDMMNINLLSNIDLATFDPDPLIEHVFSLDPPKLFLPKILHSLLSGNVEAANETLEGGLNAIVADATLSTKDKADLVSNLNSLQNEVCKRLEGKKLVLIPESIATRTLYFHPQLGIELKVSHQARQTLLNSDMDELSLSEPILLANKKAFKQAFFNEKPVWEGFMQPFLKAMFEHLKDNKPRPSYMDFLKKPEFTQGSLIYTKAMQELLQKPALELDTAGRHLIIQ